MRFIIFLLFFMINSIAIAQTTLDNCATQFIDGKVDNAPTILTSIPSEPFTTNKHLCYQDDETSFFALEYWPEQFAPRWTAYKIEPDNYGENGCSTFTRKTAGCYFKAESWSDFETCSSGGDPFHTDHMLYTATLGKNDFSNTGHDRGHIAPRQAFSWHICGTYQTFTMANMSPQKANLNQKIWQYLEKQVLTWGALDGPIYVVTGPIFKPFPHEHFRVYTNGKLNSDKIYASDSTLLNVVNQHKANYDATESGDILRPAREAKPDKVKNRSKDMKVPTGYFKVIYRPALEGEPPHAIGFLLPHTFENLNHLADIYPNVDMEQTFWSFTSKINLIEKASDITFGGIPTDMKNKWSDPWFWSKRGSQNIRQSTCDRGSPQGMLANSSKQERLEACIDKLIQ